MGGAAEVRDREPGGREHDLTPGDLVSARYRIAAAIGRGGMGAVYRARDELDGRSVALKVLHRRVREAQRALRTRHEFHAMVQLRHPRMVEVYDYGVLDDDTPYFVMELLEGTDLATAGTLPMVTVYRALAGIADALTFMHSRGYVHRDVKPANVRLLRGGGHSVHDVDVKLMDFGTVELTGGGAGTIAGTVRYLAPESHYGAAADPRFDLYSLGVVAYEITAGRYPFPGRAAADLLEAKLARLPPLDSVRDDVPPAFSRLVEDLLAPEPSSRPTNCQEVVARLAEIAGDDLGVRTVVPSHLRTPALVGRAAELGAMRKELARAADGEQRAVFVIAPAGAGKTRLWEEGLLEVRMRNVAVATVASHGFGGSPYEALRALMRTLLHQPGADAAVEAAGGVEALAALHPDSSGKLGEHGRDPVEEREAMHAAFVAFVEALCADHPVVVGIDDVHLADSASLEALAAVLRATTRARFGIAATIREGEPMPMALRRMLDLDAAARIDLAPLGCDQIRRLLRTTLGAVEPSDELLRDIERASDGNVYFVLEIVRSMLASGSIERTRTTAVLPQRLAQSDTPASLADALLARLDALSPEARHLATVIAVLEHDTDIDTLAAVDDGEPDAFLDALRELREGELVDFESGVARAHHPRVREVLVAALDDDERASLHRRVVRVLEDSGADVAILGIHHLGAGDRRRALDCFVEAGDHRYEALAFHDAGRAYRRAEALLDAAPRRQRVALERKLCDRLGRIGFLTDQDAAISYLARARDLHLRAGVLRVVPALRKLVGSTVAVVIAVAITGLWNLVCLRRRPFYSAMKSLIDAFAATSYLSTCYSYTGRFPLGLETARSLQPYVYSRKRLPQAAVHIGSGTPLFWMGRYDEAADACDAALEILELDDKTPITPHDRERATAGMQATRVWCDLERGYGEVNQLIELIDARAANTASVVVQAWAKQIHVTRAVLKGRLDDVLELWDELSRLAPVAQVELVHQSTKTQVARGMLDAGLIAESVDIAESVVDSARRSGNKVLEARGLIVRGLCMHEWGHLDESEECFERALELASDPSCRSESTIDHAHIALALVKLARDRIDRAGELAQRAYDRTEGYARKSALIRLRARRILGRVAHARGDAGAAVAHLRWAFQRARDLDLPYEIALCAHRLVEAHRAAGDADEAEHYADVCERTLRGAGNRYLLRRLGYAEAVTPTPIIAALSGDTGTSSREALTQTVSLREAPDPMAHTVSGTPSGDPLAETMDSREVSAPTPPRRKRRGSAELAETLDAPADASVTQSATGRRPPER